MSSFATSSSSVSATATSKGEANKMGKLLDIISSAGVSFKTHFTEMVQGLYELYPKPKYKIAEFMEYLKEDRIVFQDMEAWYIELSTKALGKILELHSNSKEIPRTLEVLPNVKVKHFMEKTPIDLEKNAKAITIIAKHLPYLLIFAMRRKEGTECPQDMKVLNRVLGKSLQMQVEWEQRLDNIPATNKILTTGNIQENAKNILQHDDNPTVFSEKTGQIGAMEKIALRTFLNSTGMLKKFFTIDMLNAMVDSVTEEKLQNVKNMMRQFVINAGVQRYLTNGGNLEDIAYINDFKIVTEATSREVFESLMEQKELNPTVTEISRYIDVVRFHPKDKAEAEAFSTRPGFRMGKDKSGKITILYMIREHERESDMEVLGDRAELGNLKIKINLITQTETRPGKLTLKNLFAMRHNGNVVQPSFRLKTCEERHQELTSKIEETGQLATTADGAVTSSALRLEDVKSGEDLLKEDLDYCQKSVEICKIVMQHFSRMDRESDLVDRAINTYNSVSAEIADDERLANFNTKTVLSSILMYLRSNPAIASHPKMCAFIDHIQQDSMEPPKVLTDEEKLKKQEMALENEVDEEELKEATEKLRKIFWMALDATGNNSEEHREFMERCLTCLEGAKRMGFPDQEVMQELYAQATDEDFFQQEEVQNIIAQFKASI
jgi:hypothetical protein